MDNFFKDYNFSDDINVVLDNINFITPLIIQSRVIPILRKEKNVVGICSTGGGKTHAFLLPILDSIDLTLSLPQAIIMVPTRELANQIYDNIAIFAKQISNLKVSMLVGSKQSDNINNSQIIVGTPGKLLDIISKQKALNLSALKYFVIDEADMIFDKNFIVEADNILGSIDNDIVFALFSATITEDMYPFIKKYFDGAQIIEIKNDHHKKVDHYIVNAKNQDKFKTLEKLVGIIDPYLCIIFLSKKVDVIDYANRLNEAGIKCIQLHGDLKPRERLKALKRIKALEYTFVVASDVASRGIDIDGVSHVISIDMPKELDYFIHRIGRTGRHKYTGESYFIYTSSDEADIKKLEQKGLTFNYVDIVKDEIVSSKLRVREQKVLQSDNFDKQMVNQVMHKKNKKIKPGYKKKRRIELEKMKRRAKQDEIKQRIKKQRKQRKRA